MFTSRLGGLSVLAIALATVAGPALASPEIVGRTGSPLSVDDFASQVSVFNRQDIANLDRASTVAIVKYDAAWSGTDDNATANDLLENASPAISELRTALKSDPTAMGILSKAGVSANQVVDIYDYGGHVSLYVE